MVVLCCSQLTNHYTNSTYNSQIIGFPFIKLTHHCSRFNQSPHILARNVSIKPHVNKRFSLVSVFSPQVRQRRGQLLIWTSFQSDLDGDGVGFKTLVNCVQGGGAFMVLLQGFILCLGNQLSTQVTKHSFSLSTSQMPSYNNALHLTGSFRVPFGTEPSVRFTFLRIFHFSLLSSGFTSVVPSSKKHIMSIGMRSFPPSLFLIHIF